MSKNLTLLQIQRFCLHDGPGIRSTIFLKGCPLRCPWCSNPESQNTQPEKLRLKDGTIEIAGKVLSVDSLVSEVLRDKDYFEQSGGGVTISGGEAFTQFEGLKELLRALQKEGLHTTIQTTGYTSVQHIKECEPMVDLFLFDLKHHDETKHRDVIKGDLKMVLNSLEYLSKHCNEKLVVRIPVIPGFNHTTFDIEETIKLAQSYGVSEIHLLPFHQFGKSKYSQLSIPYEYDGVHSLNESDLTDYLELGSKYSITLSIQGQ